MKRTLSGLFAAAAFVVVTAVPVPAQVVLPPIPVPPVPEQLTPVLELIGPVVTPTCGNALLVAALAPGLVAGQLGQPLPVDILPLIGPLTIVCGAFPLSDQPLTCAADAGVMVLINLATSTALGAPLPVVVRTVGPVIEEFLVIHDMLPPPASTAGLDELAIGTLQCTAAGAEAIPPDPGVPPSREPPSTIAPLPGDTIGGGFALPGPGTGRGIVLGPVTPAVPQPRPPARPVTVTPTVQPVATSDEFAYPIVFALPLVLLLVGGYLGWALTQPVQAARRVRPALGDVTNRGDGGSVKVGR